MIALLGAAPSAIFFLIGPSRAALAIMGSASLASLAAGYFAVPWAVRSGARSAAVEGEAEKHGTDEEGC